MFSRLNKLNQAIINKRMTDSNPIQPSFNYKTQSAFEKQFAEIKEYKEYNRTMTGKYIMYSIEIRSANKSGLREQVEGREPNIKMVERRYSDFENLHSRLREQNKSLLLPALPAKTYLNLINMQEIDFAKKRAKELEIYLNKMLTNREVCQQDDFIEFISNVS